MNDVQLKCGVLRPAWHRVTAHYVLCALLHTDLPPHQKGTDIQHQAQPQVSDRRAAHSKTSTPKDTGPGPHPHRAGSVEGAVVVI